jgi:hypothetical protein
MSLADSSSALICNEWLPLPVDCMWTFGCRLSGALNHLGTIPASIGCLLKTVNALSQDQWPATLNLPRFISPEVAQALNLEKKMWRSQNEYGFLEICYDPVTGDQTGVTLNTLQARLFGMHSDEFEARFAAHDLPLLVPLQDLLVLLADRAVNFFSDYTQYHRCFTSETPPRSPAIVQISTRKRYNSTARLVSVRNPERSPGPQKHCLGLAKRKKACWAQTQTAPGGLAFDCLFGFSRQSDD